ncbi:DUF3768 domain-containing protein [Novosphingobium sp. Rr 2-17]|uniref:DUF3768 domain-containing protein n=1 Tax=Novosphingobium sp. Rr 2-17 TaxID=555793 RepID=UPI0012F6C8F9|nr:DUF3768 domain-containing protein [Novosphingobium sp. Rr 2-17]
MGGPAPPLSRSRRIDRFEAGDQERDFGTFDWEGTRCFWKIDYFEPSLEWGANNPADAAVTALTILRADEYRRTSIHLLTHDAPLIVYHYCRYIGVTDGCSGQEMGEQRGDPHSLCNYGSSGA